MSLSETKIAVPLISEVFKFKKEMFDILEETHEKTKELVSKMRKEGILEKKEIEKQKSLINFDSAQENELLEQYKASKNRLLEQHFTLIKLQEFYYKYRELDNKYLSLCIEFCCEDIAILPKMQNEYKIEEQKI